MRSQIAKMVSTWYSVLRQLRTICQSVSRSVLQLMVSSLVHSRLDYGNSTLAGVSSHLTAAVSDERHRLDYLFLVKVPAHHSTPSSAALTESSRTDCIQTSSPCVQESTRVHTCTPHFVRWQMSRLVSDSAPVPPHHWLSAAPDFLLLLTELSRSPLLASRTVCQILSLPHLA